MSDQNPTSWKKRIFNFIRSLFTGSEINGTPADNNGKQTSFDGTTSAHSNGEEKSVDDTFSAGGNGEETSSVKEVHVPSDSNGKQASSLNYFQRNKEDKQFETFCTQHLPDCLVEEVEIKNTIPDPLLLVFNLPPVNRQDNFKVLYDYLEDIDTTFKIKGKTEFILVMISFDGNVSNNPPNVMTDSLFRKLKNTLHEGWKFKSYINIIYADEYDYTECEINIKSREKLKECRVLLASHS